ncbi:DNA/RNA helicase domain-containing protein [Corynebacterium halotolerans]|uniref:DNA/RNA helicase domain-containing protein n=1 Tax=Corynebacterium halotolerans TaxID=225326 RepID=UPI003CEADFA4
MTGYEIQQFEFDAESMGTGTGHRTAVARRLSNWPVVYVINRPSRGAKTPGSIYFGETLSFVKRMRQHLESPEKQQLRTVRVVLDETFNKSVCLDLESQLIKLAAGDGSHEVLNRNDGVVDADYYERDRYREVFSEIFEELRKEGLFQRSIPEIINSELFKLSPFKALNDDQAIAVMDIMEGLAEDLIEDMGRGNLIFVQGDPGTGKTVVAIYLIKLLRDISQFRDGEDLDGDTMFSEFFLSGTRERFKDLKIGIVVPQQALRSSIKKVFARTPGLDKFMVLSAFEVADTQETFDVLVVDEAHRLSQYSSQAVPVLTKRYKDTNERLFSGENPKATQVDWLRAKSRYVLLMLDLDQTIRPGDFATEEFRKLIDEAPEGRKYRLHTQMRSLGGQDYIDYISKVLSAFPPEESLRFEGYEIGLVESPGRLVELIDAREEKHGLSRLLAGFAWEWKSKKDKEAIDIDLGPGLRRQWNTKVTDWVISKNATKEIGSIHTIQGYDLNYAGVIIGRDLQYTPDRGLFIDRSNYFDTKGKSDNKMGGRVTTDEMLFTFITNIYSVLLTRGIKGTFIYAVDPGLRAYLRRYFEVVP